MPVSDSQGMTTAGDECAMVVNSHERSSWKRHTSLLSPSGLLGQVPFNNKLPSKCTGFTYGTEMEKLEILHSVVKV